MQSILFSDPEDKVKAAASNDPDYYIENFSSYGIDEEGKRYELEADRLVHYPAENKALLDRPHLTQILDEIGPTHIYADSGWLYADGSEILLTENVKVIRSQDGDGLGGGATAQRMRIRLKEKKP